MKAVKTIFITIMVTVTIWSCSSSLYDHYTFTETLETKTKALSLIERSDTPYNDSETQIIDLKNQMATMVAYETAKDKNELTKKMWELISSDKHLMGSYLELWKKKGSVNPAFKDEAKPQIEKAFDLMLLYEQNKDKHSKDALSSFINDILLN